ncbi:hypothetical protein ABZ682_19520 [Streptomyces griseoviridis]|uniref:hypothetical protein n=1 Tax=Streptomyces griseoviridis TaxID=45398 RepID=UPI0033E7E822
MFDGLAANARALRRILNRSHLAAAGLLDSRRVLADLESAAASGPAPLGALHTLIVTELWLAQQESARALTAWWRPVPEGSLPCV